MSPAGMLKFALLLPLASLALTGLFGKRPNVRECFNLGVSCLLFWVLLVLGSLVFAGQRPMVRLGSPIPGADSEVFDIAFQAEPLGAVFALVASGLWIVTSCYSIGYMRGHHEKHQTRFYACFAIAIFAAVGAAMSRNLFTLFVFYEVMTLSTYPLVTHHGTAAAKRGGRVYLGVLLSTSIGLLMLAIAWTWRITGTLEFQPGGILADAVHRGDLAGWQLAVLLALFAFGTGKAALMPFHRWLPAAMVAPTPVSALLHAVAVVKVGVFTVMKVAVYTFGTDLLAETGASVWLMYAASFTILAASLVALTKDNLKARLAYSTISQLSYVVLGASLANAWGVIGGSMHIVMHAVGKITLFFCAGAIYVATDKTEISQLRGLGRRMPFTMSAFLLASLSIIGLPPCGGAWSKWFLALGTAETQHPWLLGVLMVSSLLNVAYLLPIPIRAFYATAAEDDGKASGRDGVREAPLFCVVPLCITALGSMLLFFFADRIFTVLQPLVTP